jgi:hypothetical protein
MHKIEILCDQPSKMRQTAIFSSFGQWNNWLIIVLFRVNTQQIDLVINLRIGS